MEAESNKTVHVGLKRSKSWTNAGRPGQNVNGSSDVAVGSIETMVSRCQQLCTEVPHARRLEGVGGFPGSVL